MPVEFEKIWRHQRNAVFTLEDLENFGNLRVRLMNADAAPRIRGMDAYIYLVYLSSWATPKSWKMRLQ